ncbi:TetR family transcriptional regulator [Paracraurococcus ruber]|uniref:TetR family transcriptional regulator n=1 Tax=Paracraurococcus ruber TaxID=77675 RepID=A0ABS1CTK6_9PROT|nr:TetR family transcriptional regulator [Paracraurococcus ruber]MBK1657818.1 TetR family transcriptional regulator [Paracraurococcus ruber]TDG31404.1 TetR/AcrR family transcriptional regulator [Paracraurococcus ruber]
MPDTLPPPRSRARAPDQTRRAILDAALAEFADKGLSGARVDEIAARTATTKRMIYYYFGSKEGLYAAVLEEMYGGIRDAEQALDLDSLAPVAALTRLVEVTFDYHAAHPEFVRLVAVENIHQARHLQVSAGIADRNDAVIRTLRTLLDRGERAGAFRPRVDALDLHMLISGFCFYRVSNRHTLQAIFGRDLQAPAHVAAHRRMIVEAVLAWLRP